MRDAEPCLTGAERQIAIITGETDAFPAMQQSLAPRFAAVLVQTEQQIQEAVDDARTSAVLLDLDYWVLMPR